ncbi:hypothetical protein D2E76_15905 [Mycobacteroides abscessus]|uniref:Uncharacterized protein n=1 Tax=Mycobacteroides abscessus TaxID=36809 RepID=A0ABD7HLJ8_9MYCO|nr:helix-turn-helix domain-containing protein [Mycobacteroides abscessus]RIT36744.1 hypothetical protein D2E76_15905 [Mycobacteroides abscessus]
MATAEPRSHHATLANNNTARAQAAAAIEAQWISELGDLSAYSLPPHMQRAAELRRDHPTLAYTQLADKMGITKHAYAGLIRRLRIKVTRQRAPYIGPTLAADKAARAKLAAGAEAQWIADLGELSTYGLPEHVQQAAELRRDHPELTRQQLADMMGITRGAYAKALYRFRALVRRTPSLAHWIAELGDLSKYGLTKRVQQAAELRRDHPELTRQQLADMMGITANSYAYLLCKFRAWPRRPSVAQWINNLGDLSAYALTPRVRQAAELRRDHPELTYPQLADKMGVATGTYTKLIHVLRATVILGPDARPSAWPMFKANAALDAKRIAELGDLTAYRLSPRVRRAAELRRDHPELSHPQLAAHMGITAAAYSGLLARFWTRGPEEPITIVSQGIAELGDLSRYGLTEQVQQAAELRRDHPELTYTQLAAEMGITRAAYKELLTRFRGTINGDLAAARKPLLPRPVEDLLATVQHFKGTRQEPHLSAG